MSDPQHAAAEIAGDPKAVAHDMEDADEHAEGYDEDVNDQDQDQDGEEGDTSDADEGEQEGEEFEDFDTEALDALGALAAAAAYNQEDLPQSTQAAEQQQLQVGIAAAVKRRRSMRKKSTRGGAKRKGPARAKAPSQPRRHLRFWQPFNDWWRFNFEMTGARPDANTIKAW